MSTCYLLGSGFSKAVSDLPVMKELVSSFEATLHRESELGHKNRTTWGKRLLTYLDLFQKRFFIEPCLHPGEEAQWCNFKENFESLVSFIDLNLASEIRAIVVDAKGSKVDFTKRCTFWERSDLSQLRYDIQTYLYLALIGPHKSSSLLGMFADQLVEGDVIATFNYDLVLDSELWKRRFWNPRDGYGANFRTPETSSEAEFSTAVPIYKLHGSLNWTSPGLFKEPIRLQYFYDDGSPIFPGFLSDETPPLKSWYEGGHAPCWLMPSFVKNFAVPELLEIWERAQDSIKCSDELVVIGYSLPEADSAACLLLGTVCLCDKRIVIVDPNAKNLIEKFKRVTNSRKIDVYNDLTAYLDAT